jgi:hypothetical protein
VALSRLARDARPAIVSSPTRDQSRPVGRRVTARFTQDVTVSGPVTWQYTGSLVAHLDVRGPSGQSGHLDIRGVYLAPGAKRLHVTGRLGGRPVALAIPAT